MGKIIYKPKGKAKEYSPWAANLYNGCTNRCEYCYNRHGLSYKLLGKNEPTIKAKSKGVLMTEEEAYQVFLKEIHKWRDQIISDGGIHFNFVSDPCLPETYKLNLRCIKAAITEQIPVQTLTKMAEWATYPEWRELIVSNFLNERRSLIKFGFTLTGMDDLEPGAATNAERIETMKLLKNFGYQTWASIEPIINIRKSADMILQTIDFCDEYKIGLNSLKKEYTPTEVRNFMTDMTKVLGQYGKKVLWKDSVTDYINKSWN